ncbi:EF-hand domain-containing protein 1 [Histomonas meleagridis]|uniref:EF-hand domain-containing protein 1 n=1 Tax=Histomonas meleagridis TaxID=135588 RepID=UPI00355A0894|nr:EF-hand domain-containing protein 1 [Histomonas meleagridis]KAH0798121.1 EF-hand domain-containing protein 1 [Histomonas meleagridis]
MNLPKLPGYSFHDPRRTDYRKGQMLTLTSGQMGQRPPRPEDIEKSLMQRSTKPIVTAPPKEPVSTFPDYIPAHVAYEHLVLRFYAYFKETIPESNEETTRTRYVKIMVYLEDDTVMIEENHVRNSGMAQGVFLKRMRVVDSSGRYYTSDDFNVGINIEIFGVVYRIYSCDAFTEKYLQSMGKEVGEFEEPPDDIYTIKRKLTDRPIRVTHINTDKTNLRRFLEFDGKVLRFYTIWDDRKSLFGEKRKFILHYFLVDDSIEIRQVLPINSGRDNVSQFLSKTHLKKPNSNEYYLDSDLYIGQTVEVFGRQFLIYDADSFTKEFLDEKYGKHDWTPLQVDESKRNDPTTQTKYIPPYNGWGDEEDSLGYCTSLHPKVPKKDVVKLINNDGLILRFEAKFTNPRPQDVNRKFVIAYYLADDTIAVFELPQRNSGFKEGKFIQRNKVKNQKTGDYFKPSDFKLGEEIVINCYKFIIYDADEYALNYMEAKADDFPQSDLFEILSYMRNEKSKVEELKKNFEKVDNQKNGFVGQNVAENELMRIFGLQLHEARTVSRRCCSKNGFDYLCLLAMLA